jgi:hypothetical protein
VIADRILASRSYDIRETSRLCGRRFFSADVAAHSVASAVSTEIDSTGLGDSISGVRCACLSPKSHTAELTDHKTSPDARHKMLEGWYGWYL